MLNRNLLRSAIVKKGYTQQMLAEMLEMSENTLSSRMTGASSFNTDEIDKICDVLGIVDNREKAEIFLSVRSQNCDTDTETTTTT